MLRHHARVRVGHVVRARDRRLRRLGGARGFVRGAASPTASDADRLLLVLAGECFGDAIAYSLRASTRRTGDDFVDGLNGLFSGLLIDRERRPGSAVQRPLWQRAAVHVREGWCRSTSPARPRRCSPCCRSCARSTTQASRSGSRSARRSDGRTLFRGLPLMPGGSLWRFAPGVHRCGASATSSRPQWEVAAAAARKRVRSPLVRHLRSSATRVPRSERPRVGLSLTGGLDTRMIVACLPSDAQSRPLPTRTRPTAATDCSTSRSRGASPPLGASRTTPCASAPTF